MRASLLKGWQGDTQEGRGETLRWARDPWLQGWGWSRGFWRTGRGGGRRGSELGFELCDEGGAGLDGSLYGDEAVHVRTGVEGVAGIGAEFEEKLIVGQVADSMRKWAVRGKSH